MLDSARSQKRLSCRKRFARRLDLSVRALPYEQSMCISDKYICIASHDAKEDVFDVMIIEWKSGKSFAIGRPIYEPQIFNDIIMYNKTDPVSAEPSWHIDIIRGEGLVSGQIYESERDVGEFLIYPFIDGILWVDMPNMYICDPTKPLKINGEYGIYGLVDMYANAQIILMEYETFVGVAIPAYQSVTRHSPRRARRLSKRGFMHARAMVIDYERGTLEALNPVLNQCLLRVSGDVKLYDIEQTSSPIRTIPMMPCRDGWYISEYQTYLDPNLIVGVCSRGLRLTDTRAALPAYNISIPRCKYLRTSVYNGSMSACCVEYENRIAIVD